MKYYLFSSIVLFIVLHSCTNDKDVSTNLNFKKDIVKYNEETFVNMVVDIKSFNKKFYVVDGEYNSLFIFDKNFQFVESIGNSGRGPEEFVSMNNVFVDKKNIYLSDYTGNFILQYVRIDNEDNWVVERKITFPDNIRLGMGDFHYENGVFYFHSRIEQDYWIVSYDPETKRTTFFGSRQDSNFKEHLSLVKGLGNNLYGVPRYSDKLYNFDLENDKLVKVFDVNLPAECTNTWEDLRNRGKNPPLFTDSYFFNKKLYIAFQDFSNQSRGLVSVDFDDHNNIHSTNIKHFKPKNGDDILAIDKDMIITFSMANRSIQLYDH